MKTILLANIILALLIANPTPTPTQDWSSDVYKVGTMYPGHVINSKGEKIEGHIKAGNRVENEKKVLFYSDPKNKKSKVVYKTSDLKGYEVADKVYKAMAYSGGLSGKAIRCLLLVEPGRISQYVWYEFAEGYLTMARGTNESIEDYHKRYYVDKIVYQNGDGKPMEHTSFGMGFAKKMSKFIEDYPELAKKVANKEKGYKMLKIAEIIKEYNEWYAAKNK